MAKTAFIATGRRKKSVARVRLVPGTGAITINRRDVAAAPPARPAPSVTASPAPCAWPSRTFGPSSRRPGS